MARIDQIFAALGERMNHLAPPVRTPVAPEPIAHLLARVDAAKRRYQPGVRA